MRTICAWTLGFCLLSALPSGLSAQTRLAASGLSSEALARLSSQLGAADPTQRAAAIAALSGLHAESLPGIGARLAELKRRRPSSERAREVLTAFRHAVGSRRADDDLDIAPGVAKVLSEQRDDDVLAMAEPLLLLRSLEAIATREAGLLIADVIMLDPGVWDHEAVLARSRMGLSLLPALIELRSHEETRVKRWAQFGVRVLGMDDPALATQLDDAQLLAGVVRAYGRPLDFKAMPVVVRMVGDDRLQVRSAARWTVARFGKNAVWQLREFYAEVAGQPANKSWNAERTAQELYAVLDRGATEDAETRLARGMAHFVAGELTAMKAEYDRVLAEMPDFDGRAQMAPGYAGLGADLLARDDLDGARDAFQRALRLEPTAEAAGHWRAQVAFIDAERALVRGVVDLDGYARAAALDPEHGAAEDAHDRLSGRTAARERKLRRLAAGGALVCLLGFIAVALRRRERPPSGDAPESPKKRTTMDQTV